MSTHSSIHFPRWYGTVLPLALLLAGCNDSPAPVAVAVVASPAPQAVAMARGVVEVQGGLLDLAFDQEGPVAAVHVKEGQAVRRGQPLALLSDTAANAELAVAQSELRLSQARIDAQAQRLPALRQVAGRVGTAARAGAVEPQRAEEAQQALQDLESQIRITRAEAEVVRTRIALLRAQRAGLSLVAPEDGVVLRVALKPGQRAHAATSALTLLPDRPVQVRAEVNESFISSVRVGQRAAVTTDGDAAAAALAPARVVRISPVLGAGRLQDNSHRAPSRTVECILEFEQAPDARVGQNVKVSFHD